MSELDFELEVDATGDGDYEVAVLQSPVGEARTRIQFPFNELELKIRLQALELALLRSGGNRRAIASPEEETVREFGRALFDALIDGEVRSRFDASIDDAERRGEPLRIKLRINAPELASLPWEFLCDRRQPDYLVLSASTPLVRYVEVPRAMRPMTVSPPLRMLGIVASPGDLDELDVARERNRIEEATADLRGLGLLELRWLERGTIRELQQALWGEQKWHIFHFAGHGGFDSARGEGLIAFADENGKADLIRATELGRLLGDHRPLRLAVLNACEGARGSNHDLFSSTAATLVQRGTPAVVAMQYEITDDAAKEFSRSFYEAVAASLPVDLAMAEARKAVAHEITNSLEWGTPVLFMRSPDGVLFKVRRPRPTLAQPGQISAGANDESGEPAAPTGAGTVPDAASSPGFSTAPPSRPGDGVRLPGASPSSVVGGNSLAEAEGTDTDAVAVISAARGEIVRARWRNRWLGMAVLVAVAVLGGAVAIRLLAGGGGVAGLSEPIEPIDLALYGVETQLHTLATTSDGWWTGIASFAVSSDTSVTWECSLGHDSGSTPLDAATVVTGTETGKAAVPISMVAHEPLFGRPTFAVTCRQDAGTGSGARIEAGGRLTALRSTTNTTKSTPNLTEARLRGPEAVTVGQLMLTEGDWLVLTTATVSSSLPNANIVRCALDGESRRLDGSNVTVGGIATKIDLANIARVHVDATETVTWSCQLDREIGGILIGDPALMAVFAPGLVGEHSGAQGVQDANRNWPELKLPLAQGSWVVFAKATLANIEGSPPTSDATCTLGDGETITVALPGTVGPPHSAVRVFRLDTRVVVPAPTSQVTLRCESKEEGTEIDPYAQLLAIPVESLE
jgi:hypothetical protein